MKTIQELIGEGATLSEVREFSPHHADARDIRSYLMDEGKWRELIAIGTENTLFDAADGLRIAASENRPLTFITGTPRGERHLKMLKAFNEANLIDDKNETDIKAMAAANKPYAALTEYEFALLSETTIDKVEVAPSKGWLQATTTGECEKHSPKVYAQIPNIGYVRVANLRQITKSGIQPAIEVPAKYTSLFIDNLYGVIQA